MELLPLRPMSKSKQGRTHGYPSRVRVGRGSDENNNHVLGKEQYCKTAPKRGEKKVKCDGQTDKVGCRVASHATKYKDAALAKKCRL